MLGWEIHIINKSTNQKYGDWLAGQGATKWIDRLVAEGKAEKTHQVASSFYVIKVNDLIPEIIKLERDSKAGINGDGWITDFVIDIEALNKCAVDELIVVQTYDAS